MDDSKDDLIQALLKQINYLYKMEEVRLRLRTENPDMILGKTNCDKVIKDNFLKLREYELAAEELIKCIDSLTEKEITPELKQSRDEMANLLNSPVFARNSPS